jgi:hypothetical protein
MPDEAIYADRALTFWHRGVLPLLHGSGAGYGVLYPLLAGAPLSVGKFSTGYASLKLLQALVVSLAAVPVFAYGRRLMPAPWALAAAALTVTSPLLLYSGLVMTEVLFYPLAALTLLAVARAIATASIRDQSVALVLIAAAVLTRVQAVAFVVVFAAAIVVDALSARDRSRVRAFWPTWLVLLVAAIASAAAPGLFGSYAGTLRGSYPLGSALRLTFDHASYIVLSTGILPAAALLLLLASALRGRERDPAARALLAVTACTAVVVTVQVGFFAARYAPHLLGRDLATLPPLLFLTLALWCSRGAPRTLVSATIAAFSLLCVLLLAPWDRLVDANALPDTFDVAILYRLNGHGPANIVTIASLVALGLFVLLPKRAAPVLPLLVLLMLATSSVVASNEISSLVGTAQAGLVGSPPDWIDRNADGKVAYLYNGEAYWNGVWQERFWNHRIDRVYSVWPATVPGPMAQTAITIPDDGRLPITERYVVATDPARFIGTRVAHLAQTGLDVTGLTLWRLDGAPRLSMVTQGIQPNGDMTGAAYLNVYDCAGGALQLTLLPKATHVLQILLDGKEVVRQSISGEVWHGSVRVPPSTRKRNCTFSIVGQSLLGSTRIDFVRP